MLHEGAVEVVSSEKLFVVSVFAVNPSGEVWGLGGNAYTWWKHGVEDGDIMRSSVRGGRPDEFKGGSSR